ncbi:MAG: hypothetical protein PHC64_05910 [Candidatus Gastranaerophilales bacterium]|nr:hypothetical protein [Candidatus Gastranaerophilales bacterium]
MRKLFKLFLSLCLFFAAQVSWAEEYKVLVLPDNIQFDSTNYLVYPDSSVMFASDTINEIKKHGKIQTVSMTEIRDTLRKNTQLNLLTKRALKEFKYNYNIPFVDFKAIANYFSTNKVLVITSQTDVQSYFLRRTLWDFFNVPGAAVIDPAYKISTYAALIDVDKEQVLWQKTYYKKLEAIENRMIAISFAPATEQLEKIKFYSTYFLSPSIAGMVQSTMLPPLAPLNTNIVNISNQQPGQTQPLPQEDMEQLKPRIYTPDRIDSNGCGVIINDL